MPDAAVVMALVATIVMAVALTIEQVCPGLTPALAIGGMLAGAGALAERWRDR
jgi:hypothetical protein